MELLFAYGGLLLETGNTQVDKAMSMAGEILGRGFIRAETSVFLPESSKSYTSHVYYYNQSVAGKEAIPNGDYLAFRQAKERSR